MKGYPKKDYIKDINKSRVCEKCSKVFIPIRPHQRFCSSSCRLHKDRQLLRCLYCNKELTTRRTKYCSNECEMKYLDIKYPQRKPDVVLSSSRVGSISELKVCVDLLSRGYSVFRATHPDAPCDLIVLKDNVPYRVEVRTVNFTTKTPEVAMKPTDNTDFWAFVLPNRILYHPEGL